MPVYGNPTPPLVGGTNVQDVLQGYVFQSGIHKPEHSSILTYKYPQYYLTSLLDRMGAEESVAQDTFSWNVMDRTRKGSTIEAIDTGLPAATVVMDTNFDYTAGAAEGYLIVGDLIRIESGAVLRVTATGDNGSSKQEITVVKQGGGNISSTDIQANDAFGHIGSVFGEGSSAPDGRLYLPVEEVNAMHIHRKSFSISGSELTNKIYLNDGESWFYEVEDINMKEFAKDKETITLFGKQSLTGIKSTRGIWDYAVTYGVNNGFAASAGVSEDDVMSHVKDLLIQNVSNEIFVLCGAQFLHDFQKSLRDYAVHGAITFGAFGDNTVGLDFHRYKFMGKTINIAYYELFDDESVVPVPVNGINSTTRANFSNTSLWLDFDSENNGRSLITMKYKSHGGVSRKFIHGYVNGMVGANGAVGGNMANADDKFSVNLLSEFGIEFRLPNRSGILRATS